MCPDGSIGAQASPACEPRGCNKRCPSGRGSGSWHDARRKLHVRPPEPWPLGWRVCPSKDSLSLKRQSRAARRSSPVHAWEELTKPGFWSVRGRARGSHSIAEVGGQLSGSLAGAGLAQADLVNARGMGSFASDGRRSGPVKQHVFDETAAEPEPGGPPRGDRDTERQKQDGTPAPAEHAAGRKRGSAARQGSRSRAFRSTRPSGAGPPGDRGHVDILTEAGGPPSSGALLDAGARRGSRGPWSARVV